MSAASPRLRFQGELFAVVRESRVTQQQQLLHRCVEKNLDLSVELHKAGLGYGDLRYCFDVAGCDDEQNPRLDHFRRKTHGVGVVSFFAGGGGLDLGFEAAGFRHEASIEINKLFCTTLKKNRPKWKVIGPPECTGDVSKEGEIEKDLRSIAGVRKPYDGVFIGGPPCQPFSIAANQRFSKNGKNFKRIGYAHETQGNLLHHYVSLIKRFSPAAFLIENVTGLLDIDGGEQLREVLASLRRSGYSVEEPMQLNAADYSVPQQRTRLFIVGTRLRRDFHPPRRAPRLYGCGAALEDIPSDCANHEPREHKAESVLRYMRLDFGERDHLGRVDRLDPHAPSKTVIAGGTKGGGRSHLHPHIPRTMTVRESARLQTFPDDYVFEGPSARQFTQVGNAVPPVLAAQLARAIYESYFR